MDFFLISILFAFLTLASSDDTENLCPSKRDLYPCYCLQDSNNFSFVICELGTNIDDVKNAMELSKGKNVSFTLQTIRLGDILSNLLEGQIFPSLYIVNCEVTSFGDRPFHGLENTLENLTISLTITPNNIKSFSVSHLKMLRNLHLEGNIINEIGNDLFKNGLDVLEAISIQSNSIMELGDHVFSTLSDLTNIWMGSNKLKSVQRSMFPRTANKLQTLDISFCKLTSLPEDIFDDMPVLHTINVEGNPFSTLPETVWGSVWNQLNAVYVGKSLLMCDDNIKWIFERKLPNVFDGNCEDDNDFKNKELKNLKLEDFN